MYNKLQSIIAEVSNQILERDQVIRGVVLALLSRTHVFIGGPPGTSKTRLVEEINSRITGAEMFEILLDSFAPPEIVFGPVSIQGLQQDKYERAIDGYAPTAHIAFFSEIWKCNASLLNAMLMLLNERKFKNGKQNISCPLMTAVGDSNETPQESSLAAIYDRFHQRYLVKYVSGSNVINLLDPNLMNRNAKRTTISLDELKTAQAQVDNIEVPIIVLEEIANLKPQLESAGFFASDRRWRSSVKLLQACAYLDGRSSVGSDDLMIFGSILWDKMDDADKCIALVNKAVNPAFAEVLEHADQIEKLIVQFSKAQDDDERINAMAKIKSHKAKVLSIRGGGKRAEEVAAEVEKKIAKAVKKMMSV